MAATHADCIVLGAGIVGLSTALQLQRFGRRVVVIDRGAPGCETSYGNAGLIEVDSLEPAVFPRDWRRVMEVVSGRSREARVVWRDLAHTAPWLWRYWRAGRAAQVERTTAALIPLLQGAVGEHALLAAHAGASHLLRDTGYLDLYRDGRALERAAHAQASRSARLGSRFELVAGRDLEALEAHLSPAVVGGIFYPSSLSVSDPYALSQAYADAIVRDGGHIHTAAVTALEPEAKRWRVQCDRGVWTGRDVLVCLGPGSGTLLRRLGVRLPLGVKRGYHMHYHAQGNAVLNRVVMDVAHGYVLAPQDRGIRLTTGAEFAHPLRAPIPQQLDMVEPYAKDLFPLAARADAHAWMGCRPCLPDLLPAIGAVPGRAGLWLNIAHQHLGLTLGPITARMVAAQVTGQDEPIDPGPTDVSRFN